MLVRNLIKIPTRGAVAHCPRLSAALANLSTEAAPAAISEFRTNEDKPAAQNELHLAKFYTVPEAERKQLFVGGGLPKKFEAQTKTFAETCLMVRKPALEVIDYMKRMDFSRPAVRYVYYGDNGVGKSLSLAHILHYGLQNNFMLVHVPWAANWMKRPKDTSTTAEGLIDLPFDAAAWLLHFKNQNTKLLAALELKTMQDYVWSKREITPAGSTLLELVEHGIARIKFASETVAALLGELKQHASQGNCRVLVAIDGFNAFFHPETRILGENKQRITPDRVTLTQPFLNITRYDWTNAVCVLTLDKIAMTEGYMDSYHPRYLLGEKGFEHLDPFVPIHVSNYTPKEFKSCIDYYLDRRWIQNTAANFDVQLKHLSNSNPYSLMQLTRAL